MTTITANDKKGNNDVRKKGGLLSILVLSVSQSTLSIRLR